MHSKPLSPRKLSSPPAKPLQAMLFSYMGYRSELQQTLPLLSNGTKAMVGSEFFKLVTVQKSWSFKTLSYVDAQPVVANGRVFVGSYDGNFYALDMAGNELWRVKTGQSISRAAVVHEGVVYFGADNKSMYAVSETTGHVLWQAESLGNVLPSPVIHGDSVIAASRDGRIAALYRTTTASGTTKAGATKWRTQLVKGGGDIRSTPVIVNGVIYIGVTRFEHYLRSGALVALDADTGKVLWYNETAALVNSTPAVHDGLVYFGDNDGSFYCVSANGGALQWSYKLGGSIDGGITLGDDLVYVPTLKAEAIHAFNAKTGEPVWQFKARGWFGVAPLYHEGKLYVGSWDQRLYCLDAATGQELWEVQIPDFGGPRRSEVHSVASISDGVLFFGARNYRVYALELSRLSHGGFLAITEGEADPEVEPVNGSPGNFLKFDETHYTQQLLAESTPHIALSAENVPEFQVKEAEAQVVARLGKLPQNLQLLAQLKETLEVWGPKVCAVQGACRNGAETVLLTEAVADLQKVAGVAESVLRNVKLDSMTRLKAGQVELVEQLDMADLRALLLKNVI